MSKRRIQIYADDETIHRIELATEKHNLTISTYCLTAVQQQLDEDGIEFDEQVAEMRQEDFKTLIADIKEPQEKILQERGGKPVDVDALLEELREERNEETLGLRFWR